MKFLNKEINLKKYIIVLFSLALLEILIFGFLIPYSKTKRYKKDVYDYCIKAICNEDETICYTYEIADDGEVIITWKGDCSKN